MDKTRNIPVICGPTASGKTGVAVALAKEFPVEIVSADSRQIIKYLDIGTAKPTPEERAQAVFHLVDSIDPGVRYSAFQFVTDANRVIDDIYTRNRIPLVVGGTGLYLRALTDGIVEIHSDDFSIREQLEQDMEKLGPQAMFERLEQIDPLEAASLHPNNKVRVIRALEIFYLTGKTRSELSATSEQHKSPYSFTYYCLSPDRELLYERINTRVDEMIAQGLLQEIQTLIDSGWKEALRRANVIGYSELLDYLEGLCTLDDAVATIKRNTRRYAKRQTTWFRHQTDCMFYKSAEELSEVLRDYLKRYSLT